MSNEHYKGLRIISSLIIIAGLVLMFSSIFIGTSLGDSWLSSQENGIADTNQYMMVVETFINNFVIIGSILFGVGVLSTITTYYTYVVFQKKGNK